MLALSEAFDAIRAFMERGGDVLFLILLVTFIMWVLIIERLWFYSLEYKKHRNQVVGTWEARAERKSWYAHKIRLAMISEVNHNLFQGVNLIKTLVALCPLVGLLGTVTGMIQTFQAITLYGTGDPKLMAGGISQALVTTVLGLTVAIPMVLLHTLVSGRSKRIVQVLQEQSAGIIAEHAERASPAGQ